MDTAGTTGRGRVQPLAELRGLGAQLVIGERLHAALEGVGPGNHGAVLSQQALVAAAEQASDEIGDQGSDTPGTIATRRRHGAGPNGFSMWQGVAGRRPGQQGCLF